MGNARHRQQDSIVAHSIQNSSLSLYILQRANMSSHGDLQEMLRMFTTRKVSMLGAMKYVQALQAKNIKSIDQLASAPLNDLESTLSDARLAKSIQMACKSHSKKRPADASSPSSPPSAKKAKIEPTKRDLDLGSMSPDELEEALALPLKEDEDAIRSTTIVTNRAPLLLAFAVELMRVTMPEQPLSSRLSLAQAVVSANSRSKAVSLGLEKTKEGADVSEGQPKVSVMGRQVPVLKRGGYTWSGAPSTTKPSSSTAAPEASPKGWKASQKLSSRGSTFVAHAISIDSPTRRSQYMTTLMSQYPSLESATHNAWAIRTSYGASPLVQEASFDDGETGAGKFLLQAMRESKVTNALVVMTRWYGGVMLGPDRWRLMREVTNDALSATQRRVGNLDGGEAVWALDIEDTKPVDSTIGMAIHRPEGARNYILRSFQGVSEGEDKKKTVAAANDERQENLGRLLGALRMLFESWKDVVGRRELDSKAWSWYVNIRPEVEAGPGGWGAKGKVDLSTILNLRRKAPE